MDGIGGCVGPMRERENDNSKMGTCGVKVLGRENDIGPKIPLGPSSLGLI